MTSVIVSSYLSKLCYKKLLTYESILTLLCKLHTVSLFSAHLLFILCIGVGLLTIFVDVKLVKESLLTIDPSHLY